jgi:hypothetical protein
MKTYFDTKTHKFVRQKTATKSPNKILISKKILDETLIDTYTTGGHDIIYVSKVAGCEFHYQKADDVLLPEYSQGQYRVRFGYWWSDWEDIDS